MSAAANASVDPGKTSSSGIRCSRIAFGMFRLISFQSFIRWACIAGKKQVVPPCEVTQRDRFTPPIPQNADDRLRNAHDSGCVAKLDQKQENNFETAYADYYVLSVEGSEINYANFSCEGLETDYASEEWGMDFANPLRDDDDYDDDGDVVHDPFLPKNPSPYPYPYRVHDNCVHGEERQDYEGLEGDDDDIQGLGKLSNEKQGDETNVLKQNEKNDGKEDDETIDEKEDDETIDEKEDGEMIDEKEDDEKSDESLNDEKNDEKNDGKRG
ncbi:hypothetical protein EV360DRAFT_76437 [Lentinula raphanica]|nr:hypothetical protein EV360DRAFT_76437 [Lentinula raphanica]